MNNDTNEWLMGQLGIPRGKESHFQDAIRTVIEKKQNRLNRIA
jgi:hypothetical protein